MEYLGASEDNPYGLEKRIPVFICKGATFASLAELWPHLKKWH